MGSALRSKAHKPFVLIPYHRLRRPNDGQLDGNGLPLPRDAAGGQMGRFSVRNPGDRPMTLGGDDVGSLFVICVYPLSDVDGQKQGGQ